MRGRKTTTPIDPTNTRMYSGSEVCLIARRVQRHAASRMY